MKVLTLKAIPTARGIIQAGQIIEIPKSVMLKLKGKVIEFSPSIDDNPSQKSDLKQEQAWPPDIQSLIYWFSTLEPPPEPFHLADHMKVLDPKKFFDQLQQEIKTGPKGPRARLGTLQSDLHKLKEYINSIK